MTPTDQFRAQEAVLDGLLKDGLPVLAVEGIHHTDESARQYHYKNAYLSWTQRFEASRQRGSEMERVTVRLSYSEPGDVAERPLVEAAITAEVFEIGQRSRISHTWTVKLAVAEMASTGLAVVVKGHMENGWQSLESPRQRE